MRRDPFTQTIDVLCCLSQKPLCLTRVSQITNLNYQYFKRILQGLMTKGLIEVRQVNKRRRVCALTEKGRKAFLLTLELKQLLEAEQHER